MTKINVELPLNLAKYLSAYFCVVRFRISAPLGFSPNGGSCFNHAQDKFLADVANALHNITGLSLMPGTYKDGADYFFKKAKTINALWAPHRDLLQHDRSRGVADLFPLPEEAGE